MRKKLLAFLLTIALVISAPASVFADGGANTQGDNNVTVENAVVNEDYNASATALDSSVWTSEDFTYDRYEKLLYGCDYTRQITISGVAITGFSESGEAKLAENKDLVLPGVDNEGDPIVGVAENAFKDKGLTSVKFPTGMMVDYDDTITNRVTKRGNFVIAEGAFANNNLTSVNLPEGVIACLSNAFYMNKIETVKLPKTIWWLETQSFAKNRITTVNFPTTCDFQLEMHGMTFACNFIKSVRLPDFTEVVNKDVFFWNTGSEPLAADAKDSYKTYTVDGQTYDAGVVYMYADNAELEMKDRIHHAGKPTASQQSYVQKLVINDGTEETQNPDLPWNINDFTVEGTVVTGLSESGIAKRATNKDLVIPDINKDGQYITEIAAGPAGANGLFGTATEGFDSVALPNELKKVGNFAFMNCGIKEVMLPARIEEIGINAFSRNNLTSVILPDTVKVLGGGAFGSNPGIERISLSKSLTVIPDGAFGSSSADMWMPNLTSIELHEGITSIGRNAFAGNNFSEIVVPASVKSIGKYAFSTKNYLTTPCKVTLNEGLETIDTYAFRNKVIEEITLPTTVKSIKKDTFKKQYSDATVPVVTKVYVSSKAQYDDKTNFPDSDYHKIYLTDSQVWTAEDFTYAEETFKLYPATETGSELTVNAWVVSGLSDLGKEKIETNKNLVIPATDPSGKKVQGVGNSAFRKMGITSLKLPEGVKAEYDDSTWNSTGKGVTERGDFFIGASAFLGNKLTTLNLPEGVIYVSNNAFSQNELTAVKFPQTVMFVANGAFGRNKIASLDFPERTDFALNLDTQSFVRNNVKSVQLPANAEKVTKWAFLQNTGMEPVVDNVAGSGSSIFKNEQKGGIVYMYKAETGGSLIDSTTNKKSNVQKLIIGTIPADQAPWEAGDFTYDETGTVITGLSDTGKEKIKTNPALILPERGLTGEAILGLGDGINMQGIFVYSEGDKNYTPSSVILPETLKKIGKWAFALDGTKTYEAEMTSITFPDGLEEIGQTAFQNSKLTSVSIPDSVTTMGTGTFTTSPNLASVKLSKNVKVIPQGAFTAANNPTAHLTNLVIPEGVTSVGRSAFSGTCIENLTLPSTLTEIGQAAFENHQLTELTIPKNVTSIGKYAFRVNKETITPSLTTVTLNEGLETIGQESFRGNKITDVELPGTVALSAKNKAADCIFGAKSGAANPIVTLRTSNMEQVENGNTEFANSYSHKVVYDKLVGTGWTAEDFTYDEDTGTITGWSDSGQTKRKDLKTLVLPDKTPQGKDIVAVGDEAFMIPNNELVESKFGIESPNGMTSVDLPAKLVKVGNRAFSQNALTEVDLTGIESIGESAFHGNKLTKAEIPDTVTEMGGGAFASNDITELKLSKNVTKIPQGAFSMNIRLEQIEIPDTVTEIGETAFAGARLTSLTIPESVEKIGKKAFHLHHLTELTIPGNVKEIGESAFEGTYKATTLKNLVINEGVETIGKWAFKEGLLEQVNFPDSIKTVGEDPFLNNKGKDGSHVVEVTSNNIEHLKLDQSTYKIVYTGTYEIKDYEDSVKLADDSMEYTGDALEPTVTIEGLEEGVDYTVEYKNNVEPGEATVVITGIGRYTGTITKTFTITEKEEPEDPSSGDNEPGNPSAGDEKPDNPSAGDDNQDKPSQGNTGETGDKPNPQAPDKDQNVPEKTGDNSQIYFWAILLLISGGALTGTEVYRRRRTEK